MRGIASHCIALHFLYLLVSGPLATQFPPFLSFGCTPRSSPLSSVSSFAALVWVANGETGQAAAQKERAGLGLAWLGLARLGLPC